MPIVFYDCPLLFEANLQAEVDEIILVVADEAIRIDRIMERDGVSRELAEKKIAIQMSESAPRPRSPGVTATPPRVR